MTDHIDIIYKHFRLKAIVFQWYSRSVGVENETAQVRILACLSIFYYFYYFSMCGKMAKGLFIFCIYM